ncbi:MAG: PhoH family protein [bacterium]
MTKDLNETCSIRKNRIFVLDTNVLLHDPEALSAFKGVVIGIPLVVLEELDTFKKESDEKGRNAREVIRQLDKLRAKGRLHEGVAFDGNGNTIVKVFPTPQSIDFSGDLHAIKDNLIIQTCLELMKQKCKVTLVTKDINARVKSDVLGIDAEDYIKGKVSYDQFYKGWIKFPLPAQELKTITINKIGDYLRDTKLFPNQFIIAESENNPENNKLFRYLGGQNFKEVRPYFIMDTFQAKNIQQLMTLDLLMDDDIKLITLLGPAGTGKTFLTILAGLYKVAFEKLYRRFLIARPVVALGADIGYLPGDVQEKLHFWMQPVHDNLDFIFSQINGKAEIFDQDSKHKKHSYKDYKEEKFKQKKHRFINVEQRVEQLQQKGILSLEAITYMRGRSIPNQFVFIDEVQNLTPHEVKTLVSRAGEGTKVVLAGDPYQIDSPYLDFTTNGLTVTGEKLKGNSIVATAFLEKSERSELAKLTAESL